MSNHAALFQRYDELEAEPDHKELEAWCDSLNEVEFAAVQGHAARRNTEATEAKQHLEQLIEEAEQNPDQFDPPGFMQPGGSYVTDARDEYESAGFDLSEVPEGAPLLRAHELGAAEQEEADRPHIEA